MKSLKFIALLLFAASFVTFTACSSDKEVIVEVPVPTPEPEKEPKPDVPEEPQEPEVQPKDLIIKFEFKAENNSALLLDNVDCDISDNVIKQRVPYIMESKKLVADFEVCPDVKLYDTRTNEEIVSGVTKLNYAKSFSILATNEKLEEAEKWEQTYEVEVKAFTGLPILFINTENNRKIDQKTTYINSKLKIVENAYTKSQGVIELDMGIRGRGNSTWGMPKKPYKMKFNEKTSLFGLPKNKHWVLLADYADKTQLRNKAAFFMGRISDLDWTPTGIHVEVFINERYTGTYLLTEQVKEGKGRVEVGNDGFIVEADGDDKIGPDDITFRTPKELFTIKAPDVVRGDANYNWVKSYFNEVESVIMGPNFRNENIGYRKYLDMNSFVDWYLINEITKNNDANYHTSCYFNVIKGEKLKMGPLWDFDISLGNIDYNNNNSPEGLWIITATWYNRLFQDPYFVGLVKERFQHFYNNRDKIYDQINKDAVNMKWAAVENNAQWGTLYTPVWPNYAVWGAYDNEVVYLKQWLDKRFEWMNQHFSQM